MFDWYDEFPEQAHLLAEDDLGEINNNMVQVIRSIFIPVTSYDGKL